MAQPENKQFWIASEESPIYLFYCKANIEKGTTCVVMQDNVKHFCTGVSYEGLGGTFENDNSVGKAKQSGARNCMKIIRGRVDLKC